MKKIVVIPGVGLFGDTIPDRYLFKLIKKELPHFEIEWFNWAHHLEIPQVDLSYSTMRKWVCEVLLDFQMIVKHALEIDVPEADFYVGHSAGSILALLQPRPSIICGSPAILVEDLQGIHPVDCMLNSQPVYNLIHKRDLLAYPFPFEHVDNQITNTGWWKLSGWEPVSAHISYFRDKKLSKKIVKKIKEWDREFEL
jgi:hypothetical protein